MAATAEGFGKMVWRIAGYDGTTTVYERTIEQDRLDEQAVVALLWSLVARHLQPAEIVAAHLGENSLLTISKDESAGKRIIYSAGENPHYTASLWRADELPH